MMDVLMVGTLLVSFGLVWLLEKWCQKQVDAQEESDQRRIAMIVLGVMVLLLGGYLVYALAHPEQF